MSTPSATPADAHVFISYSSEDAADAERLKALLEREGFAAWRDRDNLFPGDNVNVDIPEALRNIPVVIVLWSANSIKSEWVRDEANYARFAGRLVPLSISGFAYQGLPEKFRPINCQSLDEVEADPSRLKQKLADMITEAQDSALANIDVSRLPTTFADKLFGRDKETAELDAAWDERDTNILVYDAMGGTGKTALIKKFVERITGDENTRGAKAVFAWSFYSQGTDENRQASADQFFSEALRFFGHHGEMPPSPHDKGVRLAELIAVKRSLVILDGLEPLQYGPSRRGGKTNVGVTGGLKDKGLEAMLRQLATR
ncbi:MAG: TIR domain-containing protein, partial [Pseudomonadota bacterium]